MLEVAGTHFEKGDFEILLEENPPVYQRWAVALGPMGGRVLALSFFLLASVLTINGQPSRYLFWHGYLVTPETAMRVQKLVSWGTMGLGALIYLAVLAFRKSSVRLIFEKSRAQMRVIEATAFNRAGFREQLIPFQNINLLKVSGPDRDPKTPFGYLEIAGQGALSGEIHLFRFAFLSEDQRRYFPTNLEQILSREATGDRLT